SGLKAEQIQPTGPGGRILKEDALRERGKDGSSVASSPQREGQPEPKARATRPSPPVGARQEEVVPMSRLRRTIAERLVEAQRNAALLTTFNEIDMSAVMTLRKQYGEAFQ